MTRQQKWIKARRSQNGMDCVEVTTSLTHIRDSKNQDGPTLDVNVHALLTAIKADQFNR